MIIFDCITSLRPFGEKIEDFFFMSLDCNELWIIGTLAFGVLMMYNGFYGKT